MSEISGHGELAESLPRHPKNVLYLVVSMRGKGSTCKEVIVRREKVEKALIWLSKNNPLYMRNFS